MSVVGRSEAKWPNVAAEGPETLYPSEEHRKLSPGSFDQTLMLMGAGTEEFQQNDVLENVTWIPEVEIRGCRVSRIPTRGFLITTRRRVLVEDNEFPGTHMSAILLEDDARGWYESGCVRDMPIRGNRFIRRGEPVTHTNSRQCK